jgi:AmmeMemoRadiSam system protein B
MQLPFIAHILKQHAQVVPILIGQINQHDIKRYAEIFAQFIDREENFFVISSDFCHWGKRFGYTPYDESKGEIWESIAHMDKQAMKIIESQNADEFESYLAKTKNTICGRRAILLFLRALEFTKRKFEIKFIHYAQSNKCFKMSDSSVSYAAAEIKELE